MRCANPSRVSCVRGRGGRTGAREFFEERPVGWASAHIIKLQAGETVSFRPRGNSMTGKIESGQLCTVEPVAAAALAVGDIVLCKVNGSESRFAAH